MKSECKEAMKRASIPDHSAGPMSRAMEDRRILTAEIESLQAVVASADANCNSMDLMLTLIRLLLPDRNHGCLCDACLREEIASTEAAKDAHDGPTT